VASFSRLAAQILRHLHLSPRRFNLILWAFGFAFLRFRAATGRGRFAISGNERRLAGSVSASMEMLCSSGHATSFLSLVMHVGRGMGRKFPVWLAYFGWIASLLERSPPHTRPFGLQKRQRRAHTAVKHVGAWHQPLLAAVTAMIMHRHHIF